MQKPEEPTPDSPFFGPWDDPQGALERFLEHDTRASNGRQVSEAPILPANPKLA